jgi:hypothetical protein
MSDGAAAAEWVPSENFDMEKTGPIGRDDGREICDCGFIGGPPWVGTFSGIDGVGPMPGGALRREHRLDRRRREHRAALVDVTQLCQRGGDLAQRFGGLRDVPRSRLASCTSSGLISTQRLRPSALPPAARFRSRAAFSFATSRAFTYW